MTVNEIIDSEWDDSEWDDSEWDIEWMGRWHWMG
jgi:hypothetical protein